MAVIIPNMDMPKRCLDCQLMATQQTETLVNLLDNMFQEYSQLVDSLVDCEASIASRKVDDFCINSMRSILGTYYLLKS